MDVYNEDILNLWRALNSHEVKYILIGGFAVNLHKHYRTTADIDLYINDTTQNREHLGKALEELEISTYAFVSNYRHYINGL